MQYDRIYNVTRHLMASLLPTLLSMMLLSLTLSIRRSWEKTGRGNRDLKHSMEVTDMKAHRADYYTDPTAFCGALQ